MAFAKSWGCVLLGMLIAAPAVAGGPRFVTGTNYAVPGTWMVFGTSAPAYFTDPGNLSKTVTHAQADAVVAAAAAVWTVPASSLVLAQGGELAEHVSGGNTFFDGTGVEFPSDASAANWQNIAIAVVYDTDGSITDLLLGEGASDPSSCRQNEVTESVDGFGANGTIEHAVLVVNGLCVTSAANSLLQMQYMVMRGFGRVIGMGWSQTNDNVFTGSPAPTADQMMYWPVMHPMDVVCGSYTYLCMQNPFALRPDDLSWLATLYPVTAANARPGQALTSTAVYAMDDFMLFPGNIGMDMVNFTTTLRSNNYTQDWQVSSGLSGIFYQQNAGNPVTGPEPEAENAGSPGAFVDSHAYLRVYPNPGSAVQVYVAWEAVNPLYTGAYALATFQRPPTMYAGTEKTFWNWAIPNLLVGTTITDGGTTCYTATNGSEGAPQAADATGWWTNVLCGRSYPAWGSVTVKGGRTWTLETTALDENGNVSTMKAQPVLGVWNASDATGTLPTVAAEPLPMNGAVPGMTQLAVDAAAGDGSYRFTIADEFGGGRPDFGYRARVLYADSVTPATVGVTGGQITIAGMGFAGGNEVLVNGVVAKVVSWAANQIVAVAPSMSAAKATAGLPVSVEVVDLTTNGSTTISGALTYPGGGAYGLVKVSAPASLETGVTAGTAFAVRVLASDGVTPVAGVSVSVAVTSGSAGLVGCGSVSSCSLVTNASGLAQTFVTGVAAGSVGLTATVSGGATVQVSVVDADPVRSVVMTTAAAYVAAGAAVTVPVVLHVVQDGNALGGATVGWTGTSGLVLSSASTVSDASGAATVSVSTASLAAGSGSVQGCAWTTVCAGWAVVAVGASQWRPGVVSGAGQSVPFASALAAVVVQVTDGAGHALLGAPVSVAQTVTAWEQACPAQGRCPAAPVIASGTTTAVSDANGLVSIVPLQVSGVPQVVNVAVSVGTVGFVALSLVKTP